jgi:hypothetical protein
MVLSNLAKEIAALLEQWAFNLCREIIIKLLTADGLRKTT